MDSNRSPEQPRVPITNVNPSEPISPPSLEVRYLHLGSILARYDQLIPTVGLMQWTDEGGDRLERQKEFDSARALTHVREVLSARFPGEADQNRVVSATARFFGHAADLLNPDYQDTVPLGQFDKFLTRFPDSMIAIMGDGVTAVEVAEVIDIGVELLEKEKQYIETHPQHASLHEDNFTPEFAGRLIFEKIPEALANVGQDRQVVFDKLKAIAVSEDKFKLGSAVDYYRKFSKLSDTMQKKVNILIHDMKASTNSNSQNPFGQVDRQAWNNEVYMGKERRVPVWDDLVRMVSCTEEDDLEYGLGITKTGDTEPPIIEYVRGNQKGIKNHTEQRAYGQAVFFHAHPCRSPDQEPFSPLVSPGDMDAQFWANYGGGYMNIVLLGGATVHLGAGRNPRLNGNLNMGKVPRYVYQIETGDFKGELITQDRKNLERREQVLKGILEAGLPFAYTITDTAANLHRYFLHVPWRQLDLSIDLYDITHGEGLPKLLKTLDLGVDLPKSKNLCTALVDADR